MDQKNAVPGMIIIGIGVTFLLMNFGIISMAYLWPVFLLIPGLVFELAYFTTGKNPGLLVPGGILTVHGIMFFTANTMGYWIYEFIWPFSIFAVAFGLFQLYLFGKKEKALLFVSIGLAIGSMFFVTMSIFNYNFSLVIALVCIGIGSMLLMDKKKSE